MKNLRLCLMALLITVASCNKNDDDFLNLGGNQSPIGEVGNTIAWTVGQFGISNTSMRVTKLEGGVSTFQCSGSTTNSTYTDLLKMVPTERFPGTVSISGNTVTAEVNAKVTDEGAQVIFNDGSKLTLVNYGSKVGDKYTATVGGTTLENEVVEKSTEDDYLWVGGMYLKVIKVNPHYSSAKESDIVICGVLFLIVGFNKNCVKF
ncbi:hypothetical protein [Sunxiuqinia indica]|uniref:hypothetical protein n=1 Tax=Sunxiuqinia indica TaxID=2692584 RepID=UPI00135721EB|nr:hypothetical protein [Sunxiuqinia indica]